MSSTPAVPTLKIGDKEYPVKYTFGAFCAMHERHGVNVFDMQHPTPKMVAVLIWGAIIHQEPMITPDEIVARLTMEQAVEGNNVCTNAIINVLPKRKEESAG